MSPTGTFDDNTSDAMLIAHHDTGHKYEPTYNTSDAMLIAHHDTGHKYEPTYNTSNAMFIAHRDIQLTNMNQHITQAM